MSAIRTATGSARDCRARSGRVDRHQNTRTEYRQKAGRQQWSSSTSWCKCCQKQGRPPTDISAGVRQLYKTVTPSWTQKQ